MFSKVTTAVVTLLNECWQDMLQYFSGRGCKAEEPQTNLMLCCRCARRRDSHLLGHQHQNIQFYCLNQKGLRMTQVKMSYKKSHLRILDSRRLCDSQHSLDQQ